MSWLTKLLGRSEPEAPAPPEALGTESDPVPMFNSFAKFGDIKGESKDAPHEPLDDLGAGGSEPVPSVDIFLKMADIKGESKDAPPEPLGELSGEQGAAGYAKVEPAGTSHDETITIHGGRTEDAGISGLYKSDDITLKRGTFGPEDDGGFDVKLEEVVPTGGIAPRTSSDPEEGGEAVPGGPAASEVPTEPVSLDYAKIQWPSPSASADPEEGGEAVPGGLQAGGEIPTEELSLNFAKISMEYKSVEDSKTAGDGGERHYDISAREGDGTAPDPSAAPNKGEIELQSWTMESPPAAQGIGDTATHEVGHWIGDEPPPEGPSSLTGGDDMPVPAATKGEEIEVESFRWGVTPAGDDDGGVDALGRKAGEGEDYLAVKLEDVKITSYQTGGSGTEDEQGGTEDISIGIGELQEEDEEPSTLASLEVQEPGAIGAAIGSKAADGDDDLPDLDLDGDDMDVEV